MVSIMIYSFYCPAYTIYNILKRCPESIQKTCKISVTALVIGVLGYWIIISRTWYNGFLGIQADESQVTCKYKPFLISNYDTFVKIMFPQTLFIENDC